MRRITILSLASLMVTACDKGQEAVGPRNQGIRSQALIASDRTIVLRGTVIVPDGVLKHGYVAILNGRIVSVSEKQPDIPGALTVNTEGIIAPGFVDVHNHVRWNVLPRWTPPRVYANQPDWADSDEFAQFRRPLEQIEGTMFCDMNAWGELRALVGGTTAMLATEPRACIHGLVRNLDFNSGFYGTTELDREHIYNSGFRFPIVTDLFGRAQLVGLASFLIANPLYEALVMHVAEGTDAFAREQFTFLESQGLLNPKGVLIHGVPLTAGDFQSMAGAGTALIWSPRSNLELYGATANISAALDAGVEIALAPDWALTGSSNMLDELKVAARWNRDHLGGRLSDRELVDMVTSVPAHAVGVDDEAGAIRAGLRADLIVISGKADNPLRSIIDGGATAVQLVLINGTPLYGAREFMEMFWSRDALEEIRFGFGPKKMLATPVAGFMASDISSRLSSALQAEGTSLAPLIDGGQ
jgi:5-methylthioadenosine/S-adenosylhomocysteine deaminase